MSTFGSDDIPPEGYTEDEMGLLRDPESSGSHNWADMMQTTPQVNGSQPQGSEQDPYGTPNDETSGNTRRLVLKIVAIAAALFIVFFGVTGLLLFTSARRVKTLASDVQSQAATLKDAFLDGDEQALRSSSASISSGVKEMESEVNSPVWGIWQVMPFVGTDISNAKTLITCAGDLSDNALTPLVNDLAGVRFSDMMQDGRINTELIRRMRDVVVAASPVIVKDAQIMSQLPNGSIGAVNDVIDKVRDPLNEAGTVLQDADGLFNVLLGMLGDGGQTRTYVLLAQSNSEIRSSGGFPGSVGELTITDGVMTLGDFVTVRDLKGRIESDDFRATTTPEEDEAFMDILATDAAGITFTPNFLRSGELMREFWSKAYDKPVDGVYGLDPVFVQRMLQLTGGFIAEDGTEINGDNAAAEILSNVYWRYGAGDYDSAVAESNNEQEDAFFNDVARRAAELLFSNLGSVDFNTFLDVIMQAGKDRHLQVWAANADEEELMRKLGITGEMQSDITKPEIGIYANDMTWSKISWYLDLWADIDEGTKNDDGTTTYRVTAHLRNNMTEEELLRSPLYVQGTSPGKYSDGDMINCTYVMAPLGGTIIDYYAEQGDNIPDNPNYIPEDFNYVPVYGRDTWRTVLHSAPQREATITFGVVVPAEATEKPVFRYSPLCHE